MRWLRAFWIWFTDPVGAIVGDWEPDMSDPLLVDESNAPHELGAVLRMHRIGWPMPAAMKLLGMKHGDMINAMNKAIGDEGDAFRSKRPLHCPKVDKGTV
jgi:hypothetical protein